MPEPLPTPIRVLVKGASTVGWLGVMGGPRTDFGFPRALETALLQAGRPAQVVTHSVGSERVKTTLLTWEEEFTGWSPDVVVMIYGHYETIHLFLPWWLERHANSMRARPRRVTALYRKHVLRPFWMFLARLQARVDSSVEPTLRKGRPRRVAADLETLIGQVQKLGSPLVYVFELLPPAKRYQSWFPGMAARIGVMNTALEQLVERIDLPNVRLFKVSPLVDKYADGDIEVATPDGFHYSPYLHRMIGVELAAEIEQWADTQEHLKIGE